jgi:hypothetical protein
MKPNLSKLSVILKNMKNIIMLLSDKIYLGKRALIETVVDELKNICQIEYTPHRSRQGPINNLISGLIVFGRLPKEPSLTLEIIDSLTLNM